MPIKSIATLNVIAWTGFWAFGFVALTASDLSPQQMLTAAVLAGTGFLTGMLTYMKLCNAVFPTQRIAPQSEG
jgi:energy-converting hydrogenase Eha subunit G